MARTRTLTVAESFCAKFWQDEFKCHALNRDVWGDDLVKNLVRASFVLWQANETTEGGARYCTLYKVRGAGFPHVGIVDPVTGAMMKDNARRPTVPR